MPWRSMTTKVIHLGSRFGISGTPGDHGVGGIHDEVHWRVEEWREHLGRWRGCALLYVGSD